MNKIEFSEEYVSERQDPLQPTHQDFDYSAISAALGEDVDLCNEEVRQQVADAIGGILRFCLNINLNSNKAQIIVGRRLIGLAWVLNPAFFENSPSLATLGKRLGIKSPYPLASITGEITQTLGIHNRAQNHAPFRGKGSRKAYAASKAGSVASKGGHHLAEADGRSNAATGKPEPKARLVPISSISRNTIKKGKESFLDSVNKLVPKQTDVHA